MNINLKVSNEIQEKIEALSNEKLIAIIDEILQQDETIEKLIIDTIKSQVKSEALRCLQSNELRSKMAQKVYPIVYRVLWLVEGEV